MISKFETTEERQKKADRTKMIFSIIMVSILLMSVASFALFYNQSTSQESGSTAYNNYKFVYSTEGWKTSIKTPQGPYYIATKYFPGDVEDINYLGSPISNNDFQSIIYFVAKTDVERAAANEIDQNILAQKKEMTCLPEDANESACYNMTIRSCENANYLQKIIVFDETDNENETSIIYSNNCLRIKGSQHNLIRAADKAIFMIFNIIKTQ